MRHPFEADLGELQILPVQLHLAKHKDHVLETVIKNKIVAQA